jgi:hypothetical protein
MATKYIGLGTVFKVDENDDGNSHTTITLVVTGTPPGRTRELVDGTSLSDTLSTYEAGIEQHSQMVFTQFWEPGDTQHESLDTLFGSKAVVEWQIVYTTGTPKTDEFEGFVSGLEPQAIVHNGIYQRQVTIQRKSATTRT